MLEYVQSKNRQGIFFTKPVEKIHLPDGGELGMRKPEERWNLELDSIIFSLWMFRIETAASPFDLDTFLVRSFSQQIKEVNKDTGNLNIFPDRPPRTASCEFSWRDRHKVNIG